MLRLEDKIFGRPVSLDRMLRIPRGFCCCGVTKVLESAGVCSCIAIAHGKTEMHMVGVISHGRHGLMLYMDLPITNPQLQSLACTSVMVYRVDSDQGMAIDCRVCWRSLLEPVPDYRLARPDWAMAISLHLRPHLTVEDYSLPCFLAHASRPSTPARQFKAIQSNIRRPLAAFWSLSLPTSALTSISPHSLPAAFCAPTFFQSTTRHSSRRSPAFHSTARNNFASKCKSHLPSPVYCAALRVHVVCQSIRSVAARNIVIHRRVKLQNHISSLDNTS